MRFGRFRQAYERGNVADAISSRSLPYSYFESLATEPQPWNR